MKRPTQRQVVLAAVRYVEAADNYGVLEVRYESGDETVMLREVDAAEATLKEADAAFFEIVRAYIQANEEPTR